MKLIVSQITKEITTTILKKYPDAKLITNKNCDVTVDVGYTGYEEFNDETTFLSLLFSAKEIIYIPIDSIQTLATSTEYYLFLARQEGIPVEIQDYYGKSEVDTDRENYLCLIDKRKSIQGRQLWCVGDSFTYGYGVSDTERYPAILANKLNLPMNLLALPGSNIPWAADQILRSDIRKNDIIVWGLTEIQRMTYVANQTAILYGVQSTIQFDDKKIINKILINKQHMMYQALISIEQINNFCNAIGAKLFILGLLGSYIDFLYFKNFKNYYYYHHANGKYEDLASDNSHPGIKQHQFYAETILLQLEKRGYI